MEAVTYLGMNFEKLRSRINASADVYKNHEEPNYSSFNSAEKIVEHINSVLIHPENKVTEIKPITLGVTYPYNDSNPYSHDTYEITLVNGLKFKVHRWYGRPNWSGNVLFCNTLEVVYETVA